MSKAAFTVKAFGVCLAVLGLTLVVASNVLLGLFGIPATSEVWIRVVGELVDDFRSLERTRLRSPVERDMALARALHSPEFHLVTPGGNTRSRESYLAAVQTGAITYLKWQAVEIMVRRFSDVVLLRYQAEPETPSQAGGTSSFVCWHTDSYELHKGS